jgi:signal transduction histidine kinase/ActR/RegA family two-component response regulator
LLDYQAVLQGKAVSYSREKQYVRKDRSLVWVNQTLSLVRDAAGVPKRFIGVAEDISYRKRMEDELFRAQKLESLGILAGGIAHDFNNMLTAIVGQIGLARMKLTAGDVLGQRLDEAEKAALRAKGLTQQLLTFAKGGAPVKDTLSLERLVRESAGLVLSGTSIISTLTAVDPLWSVDADGGQIGQALNNLIINACQAMPDGGSLRMGLENSEVEGTADLPLKKGRYVKFTIADEGVGIPPEHLSKIFDPYFTTKEKGSGLGLAVGYSIIKNHGGHIQVESRPGTGTVFTVYLPASKKTAAESRSAEDMHVKGSGRVLFMDDEEMIRQVAGEILGALGYDVEFAREGDEAIECYRKAREEGRPFDAVIMDLTISGGRGGKETIQMLRAYDPGVKAIVSSGYSNDPVMARCGDYGFKEVIVKPYSSAELSRKLHALIANE